MEKLWAVLQTERARGFLAVVGWVLAIWIAPMPETHPFFSAVASFAAIVFTALLFWPEIRSLRVTYNQQTRNESPIWLYLFACVSLVAVVLSGVKLYWSQKNRPQRMTASDFSSLYLQGKRLYLADLVGPDNMIEGRTFEDCWIYGPAVIVAATGTDLSENHFDADADTTYITVAKATAGGNSGLILIRDCKFRHCTFFRVSIAGTAEMNAQWKAENYGTGTDHPHEIGPPLL
jgi:hypothetical protein